MPLLRDRPEETSENQKDLTLEAVRKSILPNRLYSNGEITMPDYDFDVVANQPHPTLDASIVTLSAKNAPSNPSLGSGKVSGDLRFTVHDKDEAAGYVVGEPCKLTINMGQAAKPPVKPTGTSVSSA